MHVGSLNRSVKDAALTLSVLLGPDGQDPYAVPVVEPDISTIDLHNPQLKIGWIAEGPFQPVAQTIQKAVADAASVLKNHGWIVEPVSLDKWKQNKPQPAINGLNELINFGLNTDMEAKSYLAIAEIFLEQKMQAEAMDNLEKSAERIQDQNERGQIYYRIAELSFDAKSYDRALSAYQEVIKNSQSKKQIREGNLKTVRIYRLKGNLDLAISSIKNMLLDENYKSIFADLELELAKLYDQQNMISESKNRLESIVQDYPKSIASAEAYYMLGNYSIEQDWDMGDALKHYSSVVKENKQSLYAQPAQVRIKEINAYQHSKLNLVSWSLRIAESDTISDFYFTENEQNDLAKILYSITELEAFHFDRSDTGLVYLDLLIQYAYQSKLFPKALYA